MGLPCIKPHTHERTDSMTMTTRKAREARENVAWPSRVSLSLSLSFSLELHLGKHLAEEEQQGVHLAWASLRALPLLP